MVLTLFVTMPRLERCHDQNDAMPWWSLYLTDEGTNLLLKFFLAYLNYSFINKINRDFIDWQLNQSIVTAWKVSVFGIFLVAFSRIRTETHQNNSECGHFLRSEWKLLIKILRSSPPWFELKNLNLVVCQRLRKVLTRK